MPVASAPARALVRPRKTWPRRLSSIDSFEEKSSSGSSRYSQLVSVVTGDGSDLTLISVQRWDDDAVHLAQHDALVGRDAHYKHLAVSLGGAVVRVNANVRYAGPGGEADLLGVYFADAGQHLEHRLFVDHNAPKTRSNVDYKGALQGQGAHSVWVGDVLIRKVAEGIETYESNRNLVLTDGCQADSVPNLEIETGEIEGAGHASTTGRFDDEQLFYLQSRGIHEDEARRLVVHGFFNDIIRRIGVREIEEELRSTVEDDADRALLGQVGQGAGPHRWLSSASMASTSRSCRAGTPICCRTSVKKPSTTIRRASSAGMPRDCR